MLEDRSLRRRCPCAPAEYQLPAPRLAEDVAKNPQEAQNFPCKQAERFFELVGAAFQIGASPLVVAELVEKGPGSRQEAARCHGKDPLGCHLPKSSPG